MGKRAKIVEEIERALAQADVQPGHCLYGAHHAANVLWRHRYKAVIQAGSLQWPRLRPEDDDGVVSTHYSFMWSPHTIESRASMALGNLPEMHVWVGILDTQELVDFTTRHLRFMAEVRGMGWTAPDPPAYLWCGADSLPDGVVYRPNRDASIYACEKLQDLFDPPYLKRMTRRC